MVDLREKLECLYRRLNRACFISPDPLQFVQAYPDPADREIAGMIASSLAFGNVSQILRSISAVLDHLPRPAQRLDSATHAWLAQRFSGFRHRYVTGVELTELLWGIKLLRESHGSLRACFLREVAPGHPNVLPALEAFVAQLRAEDGHARNYLLPDPARGSACKRLNLFLRWMVRRDDVDPGGWNGISPAQLIVPLDTHMHRISRALGLTLRNAGDLRTALEITEAFRAFTPEDPVRYDFALTRLGIRDDTSVRDFLRECGRTML